MPIGVPKVVFEAPEDEEPSCNRLYYLRFLFLGQELESEIGNQICCLLVHFTLDDPTKDFYFFINSPGGSIIPGIAIYDLMDNIPPDVNTLGLGQVASMASLLLAGGTITKRAAYPYARVMIHEPAMSRYESTTEDCFLESQHMELLRKMIMGIYAEKTGQPSWVISADLDKESFMTATEALSYGIVDQIGI
uniref:ATP-dependent Clp protease proteolytic subunit n=1 Tax=Podranea ricasoliana TaxID=83955 RepID=A0A2P1GCK5_PODRI|nr:clp protease proteolytic subunit [Podranea ricasoliana]